MCMVRNGVGSATMSKKTIEHKTSRFHMVMEESLRKSLEDMAWRDRIGPSELIRRLISAESERREREAAA